MSHLALYLDQMRLQFRSLTHFRVDFWLGVSASLLQQGATLAVLWLVFAQVPALGGWDLPQTLVLYSFYSLAVGLANLLGSGLREIPQLVLQGELDGILTLPVSPYVRLLPRLNLSVLADIALAIAVLVSASLGAGVSWTATAVLLAVAGVASGTLLLLGYMTLLYALSFWIPYRGLMQGAEGISQLARYPLTIYPQWLRLVITCLLPVAFLSYVPAAVVTGAGGLPWWYTLLGFVAAAAMMAAGMTLWRLGLRRYEGAGG